MKISEGSWHYRVFRGWERRKRRTARHYTPKQLDLCTYTRTVFIYAPWRWFWQGSFSKTLGCMVYPWFVLLLLAGFGALGWVLYAEPVEVLRVVLSTLIIAVLCGVIIVAGAWMLGEKNAHVRAYRGLRAADQRVGNSLVVQYAKAKKSRICPLIEVEKKHG